MEEGMSMMTGNECGGTDSVSYSIDMTGNNCANLGDLIVEKYEPGCLKADEGVEKELCVDQSTGAQQ
jgi:hypothetical protein